MFTKSLTRRTPRKGAVPLFRGTSTPRYTPINVAAVAVLGLFFICYLAPLSWADDSFIRLHRLRLRGPHLRANE
jgi:hypothetical protein